MKRILALLAVLVVWSTSAFGQDAVERITTLVDTYGDKTPPLHLAVFRGETETVKTLIENGEDVNAYGEGGAPLHEAKNAGIAQILIDNGADVNARRELGDTPLLSAVWNGKKDIVKILIDHGADINAENDDGHTPLDIVIDMEKDKIPDMLRDEIADLLREHGGVATK